MNKMNGKQASFAPVREDGSRITICYGLKQLSKDLYEWFEVYLPKKQMPQLTFDVVKQAILADINDKVKTAIISGFVWNDKPVWFSEENQLNFSQAVVPVTLKIGEEEDGTPIYHQLKQQCLTAGYAEKDSIDWEPYQKLFTDETPTQEGEE